MTFKVSKDKDRGAALLPMFIISTLFLALLFGFSFDMMKNQAAKRAQDSQVQYATSSAVKEVDARGSLGESAAVKTVSEYLRLRSDAKMFRSVRSQCAVRDVPGVGSVNTPYIRVTLDAGRKIGPGGTVSYIYSGGPNGDPNSLYTLGRIDPKAKYKVVSAEVYDSVNNSWLGMFGMPCQKLTSTKSAITFGSQTDLEEIK